MRRLSIFKNPVTATLFPLAALLGAALWPGTLTGGEAAGEGKPRVKLRSKEAAKEFATSALAIKYVQSRLPKNSPVRARWAVDLKDRQVDKMWMPPAGQRIHYLLVQTKQNDLIALRRASGITVWWQRLPGPILGRPWFTQFGLYFIVSPNVYALERESGEVIWQARLHFPASSSPAVSETIRGKPILYVPSLERRLYVLEVIKELWPPKYGAGTITRDDILVERHYLRQLWQYPTYGQISGGIIYSNSQVFMTDAANRTYIINTAVMVQGKPKKIRIFRSQAPVVAEPMLAGSYLYIASQDHTLYCLTRHESALMWKYHAGDTLDESPYTVVDPHTNQTQIVLKCGPQGPLVGLQDIDGKLLWKINDGEEVVAHFKEPENELHQRSILVVRNRDRSISGFYASSGKEIWRFPAPGFDTFCRNTQDEFIFATTNRGRLVCALIKGEISGLGE